MKRDLDLIRILLLQVEENDEPTRAIRPSADGYTDVQVQYHVKLLMEAGYVVAQDASTLRGLDYRPMSLTWKGHDFLETTRNATVWNRVKTKLREMGTDAPLGVIQQLALKYVREALGLGGD